MWTEEVMACGYALVWDYRGLNCIEIQFKLFLYVLQQSNKSLNTKTTTWRHGSLSFFLLYTQNIKGTKFLKQKKALQCNCVLNQQNCRAAILMSRNVVLTSEEVKGDRKCLYKQRYVWNFGILEIPTSSWYLGSNKKVLEKVSMSVLDIRSWVSGLQIIELQINKCALFICLLACMQNEIKPTPIHVCCGVFE